MNSILYTKISVDYITTNNKNLLAFSGLDVYDIKDIWKENLDINIINCENIKYDFNLPLYAKMIIRFQNTALPFRHSLPSPVKLYKEIDPGNRQQLLGHFQLYEQRSLLEFFSWRS